jgi:integrase
MSVRRKQWTDPETGQKKDAWMVDVKFEHADGRITRVRKVSPVQTRRGAEEYERQLRAELLAGTYGTEEVIAPTLNDFWPRFIEGHSMANREKPSSIHGKESVFRNHLKPALGTRRLDRITDEDVQRLKAALMTRQPKTVNNVLTVLGRLLRTAVEWNQIPRMPCRVRLLKVPPPSFRFYEDAHFERLVEAAEKLDPRIQLFVLLGGEAGLRLGEIIALEWTDVDLPRSLLTVARSEWHGKVTVPKGGRSRIIRLTARLRDALKAHRGLRDRVLYQDDGRTVDRSWLYYHLKRAQRRAGLEVTGSLHTLRHTFCSRLAVRGASPKAIQELAGHANITTTMRYMHLSPAARDQAIALLEVQGHMEGTWALPK